MDVSQLPDITSFLVTPDNPPREDIEGMDSTRCAALFNYLLQYAWLAEGHPLATLKGHGKNYFTAFGAEAEAIRPRLNPSVVDFLENIMIQPFDGFDELPLSLYSHGISWPPHIFAEVEADLNDQPVDSVLRLSVVTISVDDSNGGFIYHQKLNRASVFTHGEDWEFAFPYEDYPHAWKPLETILSHWIDLLHIGKIVASPHEEPTLYGVLDKFGPWEWRPYSESQVTTCVEAWDRLCKAIEARISQLPNTLSPSGPVSATDVESPQPLVASTVLNAASLLDPSFARSFLTRARRPSFRYIAPGLLLPPADLPGFVAMQEFTVLPLSESTAPPVCLFPAYQRHVHLTRENTPWLMEDFYTKPNYTPKPPHVPAGLYTEGVERNHIQATEEGFRLLLPFTLNDGYGRSIGARNSHGSLIGRGGVAELFQHGFRPLGGDDHRPQRLERLFDCWLMLVENGVWTVGPEGIEGTIDTFKDAETAEHWEDYQIPPTW